MFTYTNVNISIWTNKYITYNVTNKIILLNTVKELEVCDIYKMGGQAKLNTEHWETVYTDRLSDSIDNQSIILKVNQWSVSAPNTLICLIQLVFMIQDTLLDLTHRSWNSVKQKFRIGWEILAFLSLEHPKAMQKSGITLEIGQHGHRQHPRQPLGDMQVRDQSPKTRPAVFTCI